MSLALNKVWRRHRLAQHDLDPNLVDEINRKKNARIHAAYIEKYGPRPEAGGSPTAARSKVVQRVDDFGGGGQIDVRLVAIGLDRADLVAGGEQLPHVGRHFARGECLHGLGIGIPVLSYKCLTSCSSAPRRS